VASPRLVVRRSPIHGRGVYANRALAAGERLIEYRGRRIAPARGDSARTRSGHTFTFALNDDWLIDGSVGGNSSRWINHGCAPNCEAVIHVDIDGDAKRDRVWIHALRPIRRGEELSFDYDIVLALPHDARMRRLWACRCGAPQCRGTMLAPKPRPAGAASAAIRGASDRS
jgi:SET domain-containing protein